MLSLRQKIGQLLMAGFDGMQANSHIENLIRQHALGGVILFSRNISDPAQVAALTRQLQTINAEQSELPLLIAIDQEGGMVARLEQGVTPLPSALAFRSAASVADCEALTKVANDELRQLGINVNFAPVLDVNNNRANPVIGVRAYGETVGEVCEYGMAALRGVQAAGIVATAKHFPGHGDTAVDSHLGLPCVPHDKARLNAIELAPFRAAIVAGVPAMMSAHVVFPAFEADPDTPSTLSPAVISGLLRDELGFEGVVFTDCLEMAAIAEGVGVVEGAVRAFEAGADVLLVSHREERQLAVIEALLSAVAQGRISETRIDASLTRILKMKQSLPAWRSLPEHVEAHIAQAPSLALSKRVHTAALAWQSAPRRLQVLPTLLIQFEVREQTEIDVQSLHDEALAAYLPAESLQLRNIALPLSPCDADIAQVTQLLECYPQIVCVSYNAVLKPQQQKLLKKLPAERSWLIAGRLPYDLDLLPQAHARLTVYANRPAALAVLGAAIAPSGV